MQSIINEKKKLYQTLLSFPPFFTLQEHEESRKKQITYWSELIHTYCRQNNIINSSISEISNLPIVQDKSSTIPSILQNYAEKLSKEDVVVIMKELERLGCCEFVIGTEKILISHFSPYEMADDMYRWAKQNYLIGDVETFQFISQGENTTPKQKFYKQPKQILIKVVDILQKQSKAVRIQIGNDINGIIKLLHMIQPQEHVINKLSPQQTSPEAISQFKQQSKLYIHEQQQTDLHLLRVQYKIDEEKQLQAILQDQIDQIRNILEQELSESQKMTNLCEFLSHN